MARREFRRHTGSDGKDSFLMQLHCLDTQLIIIKLALRLIAKADQFSRPQRFGSRLVFLFVTRGIISLFHNLAALPE